MLGSVALIVRGLVLSLALQAQSPMLHIHLSVDATNPIWTSTGITVAPGDILVVRANGMIKVGPYVKAVDADGIAKLHDAGALELKVGINPGHLVGAVGCVFVEETGLVLVRVHDSRYEDNAGTYDVHVIRIAAQAIPAAIEVVH